MCAEDDGDPSSVYHPQLVCTEKTNCERIPGYLASIQLPILVWNKYSKSILEKLWDAGHRQCDAQRGRKEMLKASVRRVKG